MSAISNISNIYRGVVAAAADMAETALSGLLILPEADIVVAEDTFTKYCGPARTELILDPAQIACRGRVFDVVLTTQLPKDSLAHHWNRMVMSAMSLLDDTRMAATINFNPFQLLPPANLDDNTKSHITAVPYYPPPERNSNPIITI